MYQKIAGQPCPDCGGKFVSNPRTGKIFCENKCWLPENKHLQYNAPADISKPPFISSGENQKKRDDNIERMYNDKKDNIKWLNAINNAALLIANGVYPVESSVVGSVKELAVMIYKLETPKED